MRRQRSHRPLQLDAGVVDPRRLRHCQCLFAFASLGSPVFPSALLLVSQDDSDPFVPALTNIAAKVFHDKLTATHPTDASFCWQGVPPQGQRLRQSAVGSTAFDLRGWRTLPAEGASLGSDREHAARELMLETYALEV